MAEPEKKKIGAKVNALFGELKKVTWPSLTKVIKQTSVVLAVTLFFLVVLMIMDFGLNELYKLLMRGLEPATTQSLFASFKMSAPSSLQNFLPKL